MTKWFTILGGICLLALASGCNPGPTSEREKVLGDEAKLLNETADLLNSVNSQEQADAVRPQLQKAWELYQEFVRRADGLADLQIGAGDTASIKTQETYIKVNKHLVLSYWKLLENRTPYGPALLEPFGRFHDALKMEHGLPSDRPAVTPAAVEEAVGPFQYGP
jgi:hypothetical protein